MKLKLIIFQLVYKVLVLYGCMYMYIYRGVSVLFCVIYLCQIRVRSGIEPLSWWRALAGRKLPSGTRATSGTRSTSWQGVIRFLAIILATPEPGTVICGRVFLDFQVPTIHAYYGLTHLSLRNQYVSSPIIQGVYRPISWLTLFYININVCVCVRVSSLLLEIISLIYIYCNL